MTTLNDVALLRLAAQRLAGPGLPTAAEVVRWLTAVQAQDLGGAIASVALRSTTSRAASSAASSAPSIDGAGTRHAVEAACDAGEIVRSWPMRGTLHFVAAEDLPWLLELLTPRVIAGAAARRAQLGLDEATLDRARKLAVEALTGGRELRRDELLAVWNDGGLDTTGQRGYHMIGHLAQTGTLCFGPMRDGEQRLVLVDEWITNPRRPEREAALGELAWRYFRGHGPATVKDFARWTNLTMADVRAGLAVARPRLARFDVDGVEYLMDPQTPDLLDAHSDHARGVFLLPGFDEFMLGYADRSAALPAEFADRIVPGGNGVFRPTVVSDGRVVGVWKHAGRGAKRTVEATPFEAFPDDVARAIPEVYARWP
ncbi:winged helix DNA-binding domain-containing protein [Planosporangium thailandense]|uniref:Winged helix DNA-binding domain-containing protein n=1 Tax=Planosporangium thailandense TaxID=765197 RepID=A0ABX0XZV2_9ACTN|nr:winged helix DNA-binding domain-containing protein [Planosporangium thailandense]NJC71616.1 winged helix DNA-binding domain-containing protein [Planosporangium thailandense]